jgi:hypothetical protein
VDAGLVVDHLDYWVQTQGLRAPYPGWATSGTS